MQPANVRKKSILFRLLLLFTLVPLVELSLLILISRATSIWFTIVLGVLTGMVGAWLARRQGLQTWRRIQEQLARGEMPAASLLDGLLIFVAGLVLITPGVLTDCVGFALLVPRVRGHVKERLRRWFRARFPGPLRHFESAAPGRSAGDGTIVDVEYTVHPSEKDDGSDAIRPY